MTPLAQTIQYLISGITSGSIYAMVGVCWSIVFLVTGILNFSTGEFVMLGGMLTWVFLETGAGLAPSMLFAVMATVAVGVLLERLVIRPVRAPSEMTFMVITIAAASVIKGIILLTCGSETRVIESLVAVKSFSILVKNLLDRGSKKVAYLYVDTAYGKLGVGAFKQACEKLGITPAIMEEYSPQAVDLGPQIAHIKGSGADPPPTILVSLKGATRWSLCVTANGGFTNNALHGKGDAHG
jgi:hypothetical protein